MTTDKAIEAAMRKAGQVAIDHLIENTRIDEAGPDDMADYLTRIVDACVASALSTLSERGGEEERNPVPVSHVSCWACEDKPSGENNPCAICNKSTPAPETNVTSAARAFMELFVVESGDDRGLSVDDIDITELTHRYAALEAAMVGTPAPQHRERVPPSSPTPSPEGGR